MSYSNASNAASAYREREVMTASPARLVVLVYDFVLSNLHRAKAAGEVNNLSARLEALNQSKAGLMQLVSSLDLEKGGAMAANLRAIYGFAYSQLIDEARRPDAHRLERITTIVSELRDAFDTIAVNAARAPAA